MTVGFPVFLLALTRELLVWHLSDDAYYYFNVAAHIAAGDGPTADGVTVTTGWHPLYGFLLAGLHRLFDPSLDGFVNLAIILNGCAFALTGLLLGMAAWRWWGTVGAVAAALLWWSNPHALQAASVGLEGAVYGAALALLLWRLVAFVQTFAQPSAPGSYIGHLVGIGLCGGLVLLGRTDAIVILPLLAILIAVAARHVPMPLRLFGIALMGLVAVGVLAGWWYYAWRHTGSIAQGSGEIKMLWRKGLNAEIGVTAAVLLTLRTWGQYIVECALKVVGFKWVVSAFPTLFAVPDRRNPTAQKLLLHLLWVFPIGLGLAYALFLDRPRTWYYVPALVCITLMTAGGAHWLLTSVPTSRLQNLARTCLPLLVWLVAIEGLVIYGIDALRGRSPMQIFGVLATRWIEEHVDPSERLGGWHNGIVQYYTPDHTIINLDGLANNEILPVMRGEKTMNAYWDERDITVILGAPRDKMGGYVRQWNGKQLVVWETFSHKRDEGREVTIQRVVPLESPAPTLSKEKTP